jgi:hypothetical protein
LIRSGNQTRTPKSPVKSGCQSLLLLIGAEKYSIYVSVSGKLGMRKET